MAPRAVQIKNLVRSLLPPAGRRLTMAGSGSVLLALALLLALPTAQALEIAQVSLAGEEFQVELAVSPEEMRRGLMYRDRLPEGTGMLFIYASAGPTRFWNKNVRFPIDILYFDENQSYLRADTHVPPCPGSPCPVYHSGQPVKYVLELPAGSRERLDVQPGQRFIFRSKGTPNIGSP